MRRSLVISLMLALAFLGLADSFYLAESAATDTPLICGPGMLDGCNAVAQSPYSRLFGIPLGVYGVVFYVLVLIAVSALMSFKERRIERVLFLLTGGGALASIIFIGIQVFLIQALCVYCLASALVSFALFGIAWRFFRNASTVPTSVVVPAP